MKFLTNSHFPSHFKFVYLPPDENVIRGQAEYRKEQQNKAPRRRPGDRFIEIGALLGALVGLYFGIRIGTILWIIVGLISGGIAGTLIGSVIARLYLKWRRAKLEKEQRNKYLP